MEYKYQAIILSKNDISETDRIYSAYTLEVGKIRFLAKGVRKPNAKLAGNLETITFCEIFLAKNRGMGKITGVFSLENFLPIKENIFSLEKVFYVFRILNRLISEEEKDEKIFTLLFSFLKILENFKSSDEELKIEIVTVGMVFKLLNFLGYRLEMKNCVQCGRKLEKGKNYFSSQRGGVICGQCINFERKRIRISDDAIKLIRIFLDNKIENFEKIKTEKSNLDNLKIIIKDELDWIVG